jgi:hypothetical protein
VTQGPDIRLYGDKCTLTPTHTSGNSPHQHDIHVFFLLSSGYNTSYPDGTWDRIRCSEGRKRTPSCPHVIKHGLNHTTPIHRRRLALKVIYSRRSAHLSGQHEGEAHDGLARPHIAALDAAPHCRHCPWGASQ